MSELPDWATWVTCNSKWTDKLSAIENKLREMSTAEDYPSEEDIKNLHNQLKEFVDKLRAGDLRITESRLKRVRYKSCKDVVTIVAEIKEINDELGGTVLAHAVIHDDEKKENHYRYFVIELDKETRMPKIHVPEFNETKPYSDLDEDRTQI